MTRFSLTACPESAIESVSSTTQSHDFFNDVCHQDDAEGKGGILESPRMDDATIDAQKISECLNDQLTILVNAVTLPRMFVIANLQCHDASI